MRKFIIALLALATATSGSPAFAALSSPDYAEMGIPKNYILNGGAERGTTGFKTYANTAQATPVNGTGGSPTHITISRTTSSPLSGNASLLITNSGSTSAQGEGASYAFTIDNTQQAKSLGVSFSYSVASGTFVAGSGAPGTIVDSDLEVYLYDVTNSTVIQPAGYILSCGNVGTQCRFQGNFQAASNSTSYRLIWHVPTTHTAAWSVKVDDVVVSPVVRVYGSPVTDWSTYSVSITGSVTNPTFGTLIKNIGYYRRVGDSVLIRFELSQSSSGTAGSGEYRFSLPTGLTPDTTKVSASSGNAFQSLGSGYTYDNVNLGAVTAVQLAADGKSLVLAFGNSATRVGNGTSGDFSKSAVQMGFEALVPIVGWSSNTSMSADTGQTLVVARASQTAGQSIPNATFTAINFDTITYDSSGSVTTGSGWKFTAPSTGYYRITARGIFNTTWPNTLADNLSFNLYKNGSEVSALYDHRPYANEQFPQFFGSDTIKLNAGDFIQVFIFQASGSSIALTSNGDDNFITVEKLQTPQTIAASDTVSASYFGISGGQSFPSGTATTVTYDIKALDTTSSMNAGTGTWTAPSAGTYTACGTGNISSTSLVANAGSLAIFINGPTYSPKVCQIPFAQTGQAYACGGCTTQHLLSGQTFVMQLLQNNGGSRTSESENNSFSVTRVGN